jgi:uncharacterized short protein YbdD (DUF466 family)
MDLPNFICIGAQKAGTTWLYEMLSQTPHVWLPVIKELHFFDRISLPNDRKEELGEALRKRLKHAARKHPDDPDIEKYPFYRQISKKGFLTEEWYKAVFSCPERKGRVAGEVTPAYLVLKPGVISIVKAMMPSVRLIACIREPLARDLSQLRMTVSRSRTPPQTDADWEAIIDGNFLLQPRGDYAGAIPRWFNAFPREQLLILPFGHIKNRPAEVIKTIEDFIGVPNYDGYKSLSEPVHQSKGTDIPKWVVERLEERAVRQRIFLAQEFGKEFLDDCS